MTGNFLWGINTVSRGNEPPPPQLMLAAILSLSSMAVRDAANSPPLENPIV